MKHGRRHKTLKEQTYVARFRQDAPGYAAPYAPIDVAEPEKPVVLAEETEVPLGLALPKKSQRQLKRLGIQPVDEE